MSKEDKIELEGIVVETFPGPTFRVKLSSGQEIMAYLGGKMKSKTDSAGKKKIIKVLPGDTVLVEIPPYDMTKGRIIYRKISKE